MLMRYKGTKLKSNTVLYCVTFYIRMYLIIKLTYNMLVVFYDMIVDLYAMLYVHNILYSIFASNNLNPTYQ